MWGKIKRVEEDSNIAVVEKKRKEDMIKKRTEYSIEDREEMVKREREREEEVRLKLKLKLERESPESVRRRKRTCPIGKCIGNDDIGQDILYYTILYYTV